MTKRANRLLAVPGDRVIYTLTVANAGPGTATGVRIVDSFPAGLAAVSWTCQATPGATCPAPSGSGDIDATVDVSVGGAVVFVARADAVAASAGVVTNTGRATAADDALPGNNSASVSMVVGELFFSDGFESGDVSVWSFVVGEVP